MDYFAQVSIFNSFIALALILGANLAFTLIHILQEWKGEAVPLWRVFGAVVGTFLPNWLGFLLFTVLLCAAQWLVGVMAYTGWPSISAGVWALGVVLGARIADSAISHWTLYGLGYRPNPGLSSTVLYALEVVVILVAFRKGLSAYPAAAWCGFAVGAGFFIAVLPGLWLLHVIVPPWRRPRWVRGAPIPDWAKQT